MNRAQQNLMGVNQLAASAIFTPTGLRWQFPSLDVAYRHLRRYEKLRAHWAAMMGANDVQITAGSEELPAITPRLSNLTPEVSPIAAAPQLGSDGDLLIAQQWLNDILLGVLLEMRQNPGIAALVNWESQKQVVLTSACAEIPIGAQLADCLRYTRSAYWKAADLAEFMRRCRQELRQDGSNFIEQKYLTFDPTTGGDWIEIVGSYRMIDAGPLGLFQLGRNLSYQSVAAPAAA